jgi:hypothetical protein
MFGNRDTIEPNLLLVAWFWKVWNIFLLSNTFAPLDFSLYDVFRLHRCYKMVLNQILRNMAWEFLYVGQQDTPCWTDMHYVNCDMSESTTAACFIPDKVFLLFPSGICLYTVYFAACLKIFRAKDVEGLWHIRCMSQSNSQGSRSLAWLKFCLCLFSSILTEAK